MATVSRVAPDGVGRRDCDLGAKRGRTGLLGAWRGNSTMLVPLMIGFRAFIIGLALIGVSAAWAWHISGEIMSRVDGAAKTT
jgi:hypothetical protein